MLAPDQVDIDNVVPIPTLGQNFDKKVYPALTVSTKSRVLGEAAGKSWESGPEDLTAEIRRQVEVAHGMACYYCGYLSTDNEVDNLNDNHRDVTLPNLRPVCVVCHAWKHLGELDSAAANLAYLPGLSPQDVNHLQRTIAVALNGSDDSARKDAQALLTWLASHRQYVAGSWTTYDQGVFANAIQRANPERLAKQAPLVFEGLAVVLNAKGLAHQVKGWRKEGYARYPEGQWARVYHNIMNAPI
ncbi:HNH endonuclease [Achromobacter insuavis]|uniref:HNH endonuclease n=1 Tax=Achromobacter insuavis TaxID=1287735 RepID=UPI001F131FFD|nr:HNH endonuclease [Achromobacter insuavis]